MLDVFHFTSEAVKISSIKSVTFQHGFTCYIMIQVSAYMLGEYGHLLGRRPGCSPKEIFHIIHEKLPTVS